MELAKDNPAGGQLFLFNLVLEGHELGAWLVPVLTAIAAQDGLALHGPNVDLGVERELAQLHEKGERLCAVVVLNVLPPCGNLTLDAAVEVFLLLRGKVQHLLDNDGS